MRFLLSSALALLLLLACQKNNALPDTTDTGPTEKPVVPPVSPLACDTCQYPLVMVHGFLASGDTYAPFLQLFRTNGYKTSYFHAFDWNSLNQAANHAAALNTFIDTVLAKTGAAKVALMGHSAGGGLCYTYLSDPARAAKVQHYVHIGSSVQSGPAGPGGSVPTLNLWSPADAIAQGGDISGAANVKLESKDHYQVATSKESFAAAYKFFHGKDPSTLSVRPEEVVCIAGKALYFGENTPLNNAKIEIYELNPATGERLGAAPFETWHSRADGAWGPTNVKASANYEFAVTPPAAGARVIHYYREGFVHLNTLVYLRTIPPAGSLAGLLLASLPKTESQSVLNVFSASQAVIAPRDTLRANGTLISTAQYATEAKTAIAWFLYDDGDGLTELSPVGLFGNFPFLNGVDYFFPTAVPSTISIRLNQRTLRLPNRKSSDGVMVAVFD
jgi:pimeloyl-ACP methyl ester carboxylesterase